MSTGDRRSLDLLRRFGFNAFSACLLYDSVNRYHLCRTNGFVGYLRSRWLLVALGEQVCAEPDFAMAAEEFSTFAAAEGKGCVFVAVGREFVDANASKRATILPIGDDFILPPRPSHPTCGRPRQASHFGTSGAS